jgi:hypothetical protein
MANELAFTVIQPIDIPTQNLVLSDFEHKGEFNLVNQDLQQRTSIRAYSFAEIKREKWPEDFQVSLGPNEVYLCFYSATYQQRAFVAQLLLASLGAAGIVGEFEEP